MGLMPFAATVVTALTIAVSTGNGAAARRRTLHCNPTGGTLLRPADACTRLARLSAPFAAVPPGMMCTQIFGGPQVANVQGTFRGHKVRATFNRRGGCEIARWNRVRFLFR
jgi:hypothetical protein